MYNYQIILLGNITSLADELIQLLYEKIRELKLQSDFYRVFYKEDINEYKGNQPTFVIYFGYPDGKFKDVDVVMKMLDEGNIILPIYTKSFKIEIPKILENQNGLKYSDYQNDKIVDLILESFGKLRSSRKVFISYKRDESTSVAIQLYEALEKHNFDVFLDTHSIKQGEPFQDELWHRMTDCDVILLLNTKGFLESQWCEKEIAEASVTQIGVVQAVWPNHKLERMAEVCIPYQLLEEDFKYENFTELNDNTVKELIKQVESIRARNLASRQDSLITDFLKYGKRHGKKLSIQPERYITEELEKNKRRIFIPSVGIPQSYDCNVWSDLKKEIKEYSVEEVYLIYDDVRIREKWIKHLDYLNIYLDVKTLKKQDFDSWLVKN